MWSTPKASEKTVFLHETGSGPTVLLLHGLGASGHIFDPVITLLRDEFHFVAVDLPSCGRSEAYVPAEARAIAARLGTLVEERGWDQLIIAGHSFGGVAALELALRIPERVRGLCLMASPAMGLSKVRSLLSRSASDIAMRVAGRLSPSAAAVRAYLMGIRGDGPPPTPGQVQGYLASMGAPGFHEGMLASLRDLSKYEPPLHAFWQKRIPTILLWGERDRLVPLAHGELLAKTLGTELRVLPGVGHCIPEERPEALARALRDLSGPSAEPVTPRTVGS